MIDYSNWTVPKLTAKGWLLAALVLLFALGIRIWNLAEPDKAYFDEIYYSKASLDYLDLRPDSNTVHPPLGKIQIAAGILALSTLDSLLGGIINIPETFQWRFVSCLAGTFLVAITFFLTFRITKGNLWASLLAMFLVSIDFLSVTMSRICMLDAVTSMWITLSIYFTWRYLEDAWNNSKKRQQWAWLCALCCGVACACKWNGIFQAFASFLAMLILARYPKNVPSQNEDNSLSKANSKKLDEGKSANKKTDKAANTLFPFWREFFTLFGMFALCISAIYFLSYLPLFIQEGNVFGSAIRKIYSYHELMLTFRYDPKQFTHTYLSPFWQWPLVIRPVWVYYKDVDHVTTGIVAFGSVFFWWSSLLYMCDMALEVKSSLNKSYIFLLWMWLSQWLLWSISTTGGFIYYLLPGIPVMAAISAITITGVKGSKKLKILLTGLYLIGVILLFVMYFPFITGMPVDSDYFQKLFPLWLPKWR